MRSSQLATMLLSYSTFATAVQLANLLAFTSSSMDLAIATPGSLPCAGAPVPTSTPSRRVLQNLELRNVPPVVPVPVTPENPAVDSTNKAAPNANPAAPNGNPVANPGAIPNQAAPNANPAAPAAPGNPALNPAAVPAQPIAPVVPVPQAAAPANPAIPAANPAVPAANPAAPVSVTVQWIETWIGGTSQTWVPRTVTFDGKGYVTQAPSPGKGQIGLGTLKGAVGITKTIVAAGAPSVGAAWIAAAAGVVGAVGML